MKRLNVFGKLLPYLLFTSLLFSSCVDANNEAVIADETVGVKSVEPEFTTDYDRQMSDFSQAIGQAARSNVDFKQLLHKEALVRFDGDYDVLLTNVAAKKITPSDPVMVSRAGGGEISVKELLDSYFSAEAKTRSGGESIIEELQEQYPNLQISVPVHAEDWNPEEYTPVVTFLPSDYEDAATTAIPGYDADGDFVWVDAVKVPAKPVVVVGISERVDKNGNLKGNNDSRPVLYPLTGLDSLSVTGPITGINTEDPVTPAAPTGLTGSIATGESIILTWSHTEKPAMYYIYRWRQNDPSSLSKIATVTGRSNCFYEDKNISAGTMYIYRVTAVNRSIYKVAESEPSNELTIIAPSVPQALTSFVVVPNTKNVELRWNNDNNVNSQIKIDYTAFDTNDYVNLATFPWTQSDYIYNSSYKGSKVTYRASQINAMGESSPKYDFIYPPYRNVAITSPIYIKEISFENWDIEQWPAGTAEFYLKIMGVNDSGQAIEILPQMTLNIERIEAVGGYLPKFQEFTNRLAHNWHYFSEKDWYSSLRFYVEEYDVSLLDAEFTANANINKKITDDLTVEAGVGLKVKFSDRGEQCGYADLNYFDNPENTLQFQNYGVKMVISERQ